MKSILIFLCGAAVILASARASASMYYGMGGENSRVTLTVKADGSLRLRNETTTSRTMTEMQLRAFERYSQMTEIDEDEPKPDATDSAAKPPTKPASDEELTKKIREMYETRSEFSGDDEGSLEGVQVSSNSVRITTSRTFESLKELLGENLWSWGPTVLMFEDVRVEQDTNGQFRVTFTPGKRAETYAKTSAKQWKNSKMNYEWRLELPGKILSSGLPTTRDNATWLALDAGKPESVDAVLKLVGAPLVITAEPAGLKVTEPLEYKKLVRTSRPGAQSGKELPITDAGPGFAAEPVSLTISTEHLFPDGEKRRHDQANYFSRETAGTVVSTKLFPPKGRTIRSVSRARVLSAKDDKGRAISTPPGDEESGTTEYDEMFFNTDSSRESGAARLTLRLGLPESDAQTIETLEAEGVVMSVGGWKETTVTNVQADAQKEIDLGAVLPGAKLVITKVSGKKPQTIIQARLEGPAEVEQLDVKVKTAEERGASHMSSQRSRKSAGKTVRNLTIQAYEYSFERNSGSSNEPLTLIVRSPQDAKRERVRFKLTALDLL